MKIFLLIVKRSFALLQRRLEQGSVCLNNIQYCYYWRDCGKQGKMLYLLAQLPKSAEGQAEAAESFIASLISRFIIRDLKESLLQDLLRFNYFYFRKEEREEILALARRNLENGVLRQRQDTFQGVIERKVKEYLQDHNEHINIEGFIHFRLSDYLKELKSVIDDAVESYLTEKEYREFVRLLKYFLEIQQPKIDLIHLAVDENGQFQITDQSFKKIDPRDWEEFDLEDFDGEGDYEDILVSMLVSVAPRQIMLHQNVLPRYPRAVDTLRRIFDHRLCFCHNCAYCRKEQMHLVNSDKKNI
ncbi:MAG: putative sporulation protein YtxC [Bacillota bacterium]